MSGFRPRFFVDPVGLPPGQSEPLPGTEVTLTAADSHHALRVLRLKAGDACEVVMGAAVYAASVNSAKVPITVLLTARLEGAAAGAVYHSQVGLVQALTRPGLLDQVLEKGTEVGTSFFVLVPAAESVRLPEAARAGRLERWRRIVVEAAKQSKHLAIPPVEFAASLGAALDDLSARGVHSLLLEPSAEVSLRARLEQMLGAPAGAAPPAAPPAAAPAGTSAPARPRPLALWSGPESGWQEAELALFAARGIEAARLGQGVLRAETAGPVAVAVTRLVIGDW